MPVEPVPYRGVKEAYYQINTPLEVFLRDGLPFVYFLALLSLLILIFYAMKKSPSKFWENFGHNLKVFYLYLASFIALMVLLFSGITLLKTVLEETVFPVEYDYVDYYSCESKYDYETEKYVELNDEDRTACEERVQERARADRVNSVNRSYADSVAGLIIGLILWIPHFMWARKVK